MNYRIVPNRRPVNRLRLRPGGLQVKYPASLRPSPLRIWTWETVLAAENATRVLAFWMRRHLSAWREAIRHRLTNPWRESMHRSRARAAETVSPSAAGLRRTPIAGDPEAPTEAAGRSIVAPAVSRRTSPQEDVEFMGDDPMFHPLANSSETDDARRTPVRDRTVHRELRGSQARLVEELMAEEEELTRVAAKVVRLQSLIRARQHLLAESAGDDRGRTDNRGGMEDYMDRFVGVGNGTREDELRNVRRLHR